MRPFGYLTLAGTLLLCACNPNTEETTVSTERVTISDQLQSSLHKQALEFCRSVDALHAAVIRLADNPSTMTLTAAKEKWITAHRAYHVVALAYQLNREPPPQAGDERDAIDATPILGGYLDRVPGYATSGIAYSEVPLTPEFLRSEHQSTDFGYLTLGFHPLEFMLWGTTQHQSHERFISTETSESENTIDAPERRRMLLRLISTMLSQDSRQVCEVEARKHLINVISKRLATDNERRAAMTYIIGILSATRSSDPLFETPNHDTVILVHSAYARTDRGDMNADIETLKTVWVPALFDKKSEQQEWIARLDDVKSTIYQPLSESPSAPGQSSP